MMLDIWEKLGNFLIQFLLLPIYFMFLCFDGIVYSLVAYSYNLFELMAKLNFSSLLYWFSDITEKFNSLIIVIVMFVIGYALINYLIDPSKMTKGEMSGASLLKRIAFTAVLLVSYQTAFELLHETTFLVIGAPQNYEYNYLKDWFGVTNDGDPGLLSNMILGTSETDEESTNFGAVLAVKSLRVFLDNKKGVYSSTLNKVYNNALKGNEFNLLGITAVALNFQLSFIDGAGKVDYHYPILSTTVGLYLIYTIIKITIEIGIRALKLALLEFLAPIAIVSIIIGGFKAKIWTKWYNLLSKTFTDVFIRIGSMYIVVALIHSVLEGSDFSASTGLSTSGGGLTKGFLTILLVIVGFKFAKELPKIIDDIFGSKLADANKHGFKDFLRDIPRVAFGAAGMVAGGISANKDSNGKSGFLKTLNTVRGAAAGAKAGFGGRGDGIKKRIDAINGSTDTMAEKIKGQKSTFKENVVGGFGNFAGGNRRKAEEIQEQINQANKNYDAEKMAHDEAVANETNDHNTNVNTENARHNTAAKAHQKAAERYQKDVEAKTEAMKKTYLRDSSSTRADGADARVIDHRIDSAIKFDENFVQNMIDGNQAVMDSKKSVTLAREKLSAAIQNGVTDAEHIKNLQNQVEITEHILAINEQNAREEAIAIKTQYEKDSGITASRKMLEHIQENIKLENEKHERNVESENSRYESVSNTEKTRFDTITETYETTVKGKTEIVRDAAGNVQRDPVTGEILTRRVNGLEDELKKYGGKNK